MNIILLSGGSGKRLWPLSNDTRSKQFLKLLKNERGDFESMVQRVYRQITIACPEANIVIATGASQIDSIRNQLGKNIDIVLEPERRDTFPAIALSCSYLALEKKVDLDEAVLVLPVDPYAEMEYFKTLCMMEEAVKSDFAELILMGVKPTYSSAKYGYILPDKNEKLDIKLPEGGNSRGMTIYKVNRFIEKPTEVFAERLIAKGAVWNGGVFAFRLRYLMDMVNQYSGESGSAFSSYQKLQENYAVFKKISFDYEVVEQASSVAMIPYSGEWKDLGTWNTLTEHMDEPCIGPVTMDEESENTNVINELDIPIVALGVKNLIIAASPDGILISDKHKSSYLKSYVDGLNDRPMYEEKVWGDYKALDYTQYDDGIKSLTKYITVKANHKIHYHVHQMRDEVITIVSGSAEMIIDGEKKAVGRGDVIHVSKGQKHELTVTCNEDLHFIEVQIGAEVVESDIEDFKL